MRYKPDHKQTTHKSIVEKAAAEFKGHGFEAVGIAGLMGKLKLTHGGFYSHFDDKENLIAEATVYALNESMNRLVAILKTDGLGAMIDHYLSEGHRDHPELGCPLASLSAEVARRPPSTRAAYASALSQLIEAIGEFLPAPTPLERRACATHLLAAMAGGLSMARATKETDLSTTILDGVRAELQRLVRSNP